MRELESYADRAEQVMSLYVEAFGGERDALFLLGKMTEEMGEVMGAYLKLSGRGRGSDADPEGLRGDLEDELADLFGFLLAFCRWQGVDLGAAFDKKWGAYLEPARHADA